MRKYITAAERERARARRQAWHERVDMTLVLAYWLAVVAFGGGVAVAFWPWA